MLYIAWIRLSFLYFGLTAYRVFKIVKYVTNAVPQPVVFIDYVMDGLWQLLTVAAIPFVDHYTTAKICAIFISPNEVFDRRRSFHVRMTSELVRTSEPDRAKFVISQVNC